jgi:hypothetical protein
VQRGACVGIGTEGIAEMKIPGSYRDEAHVA